MNPAELSNIAAAERDHWWYRGMRLITGRILARHVSGQRYRRVLEAGCGTGYNSAWLRTQYGWNIFLIDLERKALEYVRGLHFRNAVQANVAVLPFRTASFDFVFSLDVIVHLPRGEEKRCLAELLRVTVPGGMLLLRAAALDALRSRHSQFIHERQRFTKARLTRVLNDAGFRILYCSYANSLLLPVAIAKFRLWEPLMQKSPASGIEQPAGWLNRLLYSVLALEAKWLGLGLPFFLGQSLILVAEKPTSDRSL